MKQIRISSIIILFALTLLCGAKKSYAAEITQDMGGFSVISTEAGLAGISYDNSTLTISTTEPVTISNKTGVEQTTDRIYIAAHISAKVTLNGVNISSTSEAALEIASGSLANVTITLADDSTNTLQSPSYKAGLAKNSEVASGTLTIQGGTKGNGKLFAYGGYNAAGIGGNYSSACCNITITGGNIEAEATRGTMGTGIGAGCTNGTCQNILLLGGTITATAGLEGAAVGCVVTNDWGKTAPENIVIKDASLRAQSGNRGVDIGGVFSTDAPYVTKVIPKNGTESEASNVYKTTFNVGQTFESASVVLDGTTKTYYAHPDDTNLYFYLTEGYHQLVYDGVTYLAYTKTDGTAVFKSKEITVSGGAVGVDYTYDSAGLLSIISDKEMTLSNRDGTERATRDHILVDDGISANLILDGVNIFPSPGPALEIASGSLANVTITLADDSTNTLDCSNGGRAGLAKNGDASSGTLTIQGGNKGNGKLFAYGGYHCAGIGGIERNACCNITITGGNIVAKGGEDSEGIGSGNGSNICKNIQLLGGTITAIGGKCGAGIGCNGDLEEPVTPENIVIKQASVKAQGGENGIDIGGTKTTSEPCVRAVIPKNGTESEAKDVYKTTFDVGQTFESASIVLDGITQTQYAHPDDTKLYFYLTEGYHQLVYNGATYLTNTKTDGTAVFEQKAITVSGGAVGIDYTYDSDGLLTILSDKAMTLSNKDGIETSTTDHIVVDDGISANLILDGVNINNEHSSPLAIQENSTGNVTVTLADDSNNLLASMWEPGLEKSGGDSSGTLTIQGGEKGNGKLNATGGHWCAAIGGQQNKSCYNIKILGGNIVAKNENNFSCGIGAGTWGVCNNIMISAGTVTVVTSDDTTQASVGIGGFKDTQNSLTLPDVVIKEAATVKTETGSNVSIGVVCPSSSIPVEETKWEATPKNGTGDSAKNVYQTTLDLGSSFEKADVTINGTTKTYYSHPDDDTKLYFYLPEGTNLATCNNVVYKANTKNSNDSSFDTAHMVTLLDNDDGINSLQTSTDGVTYSDYVTPVYITEDESLYIKAVVGKNYTFDKWSDGNTSNPFVITGLTQNVQFSASTTLNNYDITYDANGGTGEMTAGTAVAGTAMKLPVNTFTAPSGKRFKEWAIGSPSGTRKGAGETYLFEADTTVYAVWEDIPATASPSPSASPSQEPTASPSASPSEVPTASPSPSATPSQAPTASPSPSPSVTPSQAPTASPSPSPSATPSQAPTASPSVSPSVTPSQAPTASPSVSPSIAPSQVPTASPSTSPSATPSQTPKIVIKEGQEPVRSELVKAVKAGKSYNILSWTKVKGADGYFIYASRCNVNEKKRKVTKIKDITSVEKLTYKHKGLKKGTWYKYRIAAYKIRNGEKKTFGRSLELHVLTIGTKKYSNPKKVRVSKKKITLGVGKTTKVKAIVTLPKNKKTKWHIAKVRYIVSDKKVLTISKKGIIKAKKSGNCTIYAVAQNGVSSKISVKVQ